METKQNFIIAGSVIAALMFIEANCTKFPIDCADTKYSFELPVKAFPNKDTIHVGDTIWLEINEPTLIRDGRTGEMIDYSGTSNLGTALSFSFRDIAINQWIDGANRFNFILDKGIELKKNPLDIQYRFIEQSGRYVFKLGVIPKENGLHCLLFSNSNNTYRNSDKCTKAGFTINFRDTDQHYYLSPSYTGQTGLVGGDYYFFVQ
jgi:hypothetical protein